MSILGGIDAISSKKSGGAYKQDEFEKSKYQSGAQVAYCGPAIGNILNGSAGKPSSGTPSAFSA